ncbi:MAG: ATP-binding protein, partial [Corynebacteriales bacterium]|nr:ATP-binding protein [Mycobacteriales bacterium]
MSILEGLEAVRKRPGMYIGSTGERGLHHLIWEVVDNSVDEAMAGHASKVDVKLLANGGVEVIDDGRGIPVEMHKTGVPTVEVVMTQLHAGGKFDSDSYAVSGGLHGVGISVVNALSTKVELEIDRDGFHWSQTYNYAKPAELVKGSATRRKGTTTRFWADPEIFETTDYSFETISRRLQEMAFLNKGLTITLTDERPAQIGNDSDDIETAEAPKSQAELDSEAATEVSDVIEIADTAGESVRKEVSGKPRTKIYHYPGGLEDYVAHLNNRNKSRLPIHASIVSFTAKGTGHELELAMQWNDGYSESVHTFANTINTHEGGTHEEG